MESLLSVITAVLVFSLCVRNAKSDIYNNEIQLNIENRFPNGIYDDSFNVTQNAASYQHIHCVEDEACSFNQQCNFEKSRCDCRAAGGYFLEDECPTEGEYCTDCCCGVNIECSGAICIQTNYRERVVSKVILATVMTIGVVSVIVAIYRVCAKAVVYGARAQLIEPDLSPRASLSSLQIGVLDRLRDRPPTYETRHNYARRVSIQGTDNAALDVSSEPKIEHFPPPPYSMEEPSGTNQDDQPPPYSIAVISSSPETTASTENTNSSNVHKELHI